jgi:hypothetical protein
MWAMPCDLTGEINRRSARVEEKLRIWSPLRLQAVSGSLSTQISSHGPILLLQKRTKSIKNG